MTECMLELMSSDPELVLSWMYFIIGWSIIGGMAIVIITGELVGRIPYAYIMGITLLSGPIGWGLILGRIIDTIGNYIRKKWRSVLRFY